MSIHWTWKKSWICEFQVVDNSSFEKFTSIFLVFKIFEKSNSRKSFRFFQISTVFIETGIRYFFYYRSSYVQLRIQFSQNRTMTHSFRFIGLGHANSATSLVYLLNEIEFWLLLSSYKWDYLLIPDFVILLILFSKVWKKPICNTRL